MTAIEHSSSKTWHTFLTTGWHDLRDGARRHQAWIFLAGHEVRRQYQRSILGPFWITLNLAIMIAAIGWFYSEIFGQQIDTYLPFLTVGFIVFGFMSNIVNEAANLFASEAVAIRQSLLPLSFYVYKLIFRQIIIFAHNFTIYIVVWLLFPIPASFNILLAIPGFCLMVISSFSAALIIGPIAARFRDIPPIIASLMQVFFFVTPIFWTIGNVPKRAVFVNINPFFHYLEIVRQPLLGHTPSNLNWIIASVLTAILSVTAFFFFSRYRSKITYWV